MNREFGMKVILWSVDPLDWKYRTSARVERQILAGAQPGAIILSHDIDRREDSDEILTQGTHPRYLRAGPTCRAGGHDEHLHRTIEA
jgi:peptidoglycan/xylan/chitin deacetylase (PgdA/CDA1 family)